jgi:hypothetical protein
MFPPTTPLQPLQLFLFCPPTDGPAVSQLSCIFTAASQSRPEHPAIGSPVFICVLISATAGLPCAAVPLPYSRRHSSGVMCCGLHTAGGRADVRRFGSLTGKRKVFMERDLEGEQRRADESLMTQAVQCHSVGTSALVVTVR